MFTILNYIKSKNTIDIQNIYGICINSFYFYKINAITYLLFNKTFLHRLLLLIVFLFYFHQLQFRFSSRSVIRLCYHFLLFIENFFLFYIPDKVLAVLKEGQYNHRKIVPMNEIVFDILSDFSLHCIFALSPWNITQVIATPKKAPNVWMFIEPPQSTVYNFASPSLLFNAQNMVSSTTISIY